MRKKHFHFMGIGGSGMSAVAFVAQQMGYEVSGCDTKRNRATRKLIQEGIPIFFHHDVKHLRTADYLVVTPAIACALSFPNEYRYAPGSTRVVSWQKLVGRLMKSKYTVAIAGTHGKSTTTAMVAHILTSAGLDPTCIVGAELKNWNGNARVGGGDHFVIEADEFNKNFLNYYPQILIITSLEFDHPETYPNHKAFIKSFDSLIKQMRPPRIVVANYDDISARVFVKKIQRKKLASCITYGFKKEADYHVMSHALRSGAYRVITQKRRGAQYKFHLNVSGIHNIQNALASLVVADLLKVSRKKALSGIKSFMGIRRRFDIISNKKITLINDYAHHPTAISATLIAVRDRFPQRRIISVFQPHQYRRTKALFHDFVHALSLSDLVVLTDIFEGREKKIGGIHARDIVSAINKKTGNAFYASSFLKAKNYLSKHMQKKDVILIMGAGDIDKLSDMLLLRLKMKAVA